MTERILITGGAGFIGSNLALSFKRDRPSATVIAFDNLKRRGSELALSRLRGGGVEFMHGDIRSVDDLADVGPVNILIEASAEPTRAPLMIISRARRQRCPVAVAKLVQQRLL